MLTRPGVLLLVSFSLAGCAEAPFVDSTTAELKTGRVAVCWSGRHSTAEDVEALAREACAGRKLVPRKVREVNFGCRLFAPRQTDYQCVPAP